MSDTVIKVENLSKQYRLGLVGTGTIKDDFARWWAAIRGKEDPYQPLLNPPLWGGLFSPFPQGRVGDGLYIWALRDINFEVQKGKDIISCIMTKYKSLCFLK